MSGTENSPQSIEALLEKILARLEAKSIVPITPKSNLLIGYIFAKAEGLLDQVDMSFEIETATADLSTVLKHLRYENGDTVDGLINTYTPGGLQTELTRNYAALHRKKPGAELRAERAKVIVTALERAGLWEP